MSDRFDLNKLLQFCREKSISFECSYSESSNELELNVYSAAPNERMYMKRVPSIDYFINAWLKKVEEAPTSQRDTVDPLNDEEI